MVTLTDDRADFSGIRRTTNRSIKAARTAVITMAAGMENQRGHGLPGNQREAKMVPASSGEAGDDNTSDV